MKDNYYYITLALIRLSFSASGKLLFRIFFYKESCLPTLISFIRRELFYTTLKISFIKRALLSTLISFLFSERKASPPPPSLRWIHPVEARPGLWAEHRPQVKVLLDTLRQYRHQEVYRQPPLLQASYPCNKFFALIFKKILLVIPI